MPNRKLFITTLLLPLLINGCARETNIFRFCRDFSPDGCISPLASPAIFGLEKTIQKKSYREFYNSVYFRGDRLAFEIRNAGARKEVSFECLHGRYYLADRSAERYEMEYIELRENNVYGLAMVGSIIEKYLGTKRSQPYRALSPFLVTYEIFCGKDVLAKKTISVELK
jgi:hypothetical protein